MRQSFRWVPVLFVNAACVMGCNRVDPEKCKQALDVTRQSIAAADFAAAQNWRTYAWKQCDDKAALEALDRELTAKQTEVETRRREAEARTVAKRALLTAFLSWVRDNRADPSKASASPVCDPPAAGDPKGEKSEDRFCTATRTAGTSPLTVRYYQSQPTAARFSVKLPDATSCAEIGAPTVVKTWPVPATGGRTAQRFRCSFSSGPLAGLHAVGSEAINAELYVFDPTYLDKEPAQKTMLEGP